MFGISMRFVGECAAVNRLCVEPLLRVCGSSQGVLGDWMRFPPQIARFANGLGLIADDCRAVREVLDKVGPDLVESERWRDGWRSKWTANQAAEKAVRDFAQGFFEYYGRSACFVRMARETPSLGWLLRQFNRVPVFVDPDKLAWGLLGRDGALRLVVPGTEFELAAGDLPWQQPKSERAQLAVVHFQRRVTTPEGTESEYGKKTSVGFLEIDSAKNEVDIADKDWLFRGLFPVNSDQASKSSLPGTSVWKIPTLGLGAIQGDGNGRVFLHMLQIFLGGDASVRELSLDMMPIELDFLANAEFARAAVSFSWQTEGN